MSTNGPSTTMTRIRHAIPAQVRSYSTRNRRLSAMRIRVRLALRPRPVVVWSMQSTDSTAVQRTIAEGAGENVLHIHSLSRSALEWRRSISLSRGEDPRRRSEFIIAPWVARGLGRTTQSDPWCFASLARNPVDRAISHFFQIDQRALRALAPEESADPTDEQVADLIDRFETSPFLPTGIHWFDADFRPSTGIDVYADPSPSAGAGRTTKGTRSAPSSSAPRTSARSARRRWRSFSPWTHSRSRAGTEPRPSPTLPSTTGSDRRRSFPTATSTACSRAATPDTSTPRPSGRTPTVAGRNADGRR